MVSACRKPSHLIRQLIMTRRAQNAEIMELFTEKADVIRAILDLKATSHLKNSDRLYAILQLEFSHYCIL